MYKEYERGAKHWSGGETLFGYTDSNYPPNSLAIVRGGRFDDDEIWLDLNFEMCWLSEEDLRRLYEALKDMFDNDSSSSNV